MPSFEMIYNFVHGACKQKDNWCDGGIILSKKNSVKLPPCRFFIKGRCTHPLHPKNIENKRC